MTTADKVFAGSIPAIYQQFLVPMIFAPYALDLAGRVAKAMPADVLEIAAGTGVLTRALADALGPQAKITATDLNPPMLDIAMRQQGGDDRITWLQADALDLPFADRAFDCVACQFGAMFFPDKVRAYEEAHRVLGPGGHYVFNVWDAVEENEFIAIACAALAEMFPADPPRFMQRTPHGYHDLDEIAQQLKTAGFSGVGSETVSLASNAPSALDAATGFCQGNPLRGEIETRAPGQLSEITAKVAEALEARFGTGPITGRLQAHVITAMR
jgi:ubiquinone/menaquinone biosynthesis C-methylase UbiE